MTRATRSGIKLACALLLAGSATTSLADPSWAGRLWRKKVSGGGQVDRLTRSAMTRRRDPGGERARETERQSQLFRQALIATGRGDAGVKARKRAAKQARKEARARRRAGGD